MQTSLENLQKALGDALGARLKSQVVDCGQLTIELAGEDLAASAKILQGDERLAFSILIDIAGVDYQGFGDGAWEGARFAVVYNLLSVRHNARVRMKVFTASADFPALDSVIDTWPAANWYEREAFDLYGIVFRGHPDLRRILTDYGFMGHPFRKDFPVSGHVEMRYDEAQKRVIYQPVTIEPREIVPRVVREDSYGESGKR